MTYPCTIAPCTRMSYPLHLPNVTIYYDYREDSQDYKPCKHAQQAVNHIFREEDFLEDIDVPVHIIPRALEVTIQHMDDTDMLCVAREVLCADCLQEALK